MTISNLVQKIQTGLLQPAIYLLFSLALVVFLWGVVQYVIGSYGDERKLQQGRQVMIWGIIGMFIMASAWGIVNILCNFFGTCITVSTGTPPPYWP